MRFGVESYAFGSNQQPVGVDAVGRAGNQGDFIFVGLVSDCGVVLGLDHLSAGNTIAQPFTKHVDVHVLPVFEFRQVVKHGGINHASVRGDDSIGPHATNGQVTAVHVSSTAVEHFGSDGVVNRQVNVNGGNLQPCHHPVGLRGVELVFVVLIVRVAVNVLFRQVALCCEFRVIGASVVNVALHRFFGFDGLYVFAVLLGDAF